MTSPNSDMPAFRRVKGFTSLSECIISACTWVCNLPYLKQWWFIGYSWADRALTSHSNLNADAANLSLNFVYISTMWVDLVYSRHWVRRTNEHCKCSKISFTECHVNMRGRVHIVLNVVEKQHWRSFVSIGKKEIYVLECALDIYKDMFVCLYWFAQQTKLHWHPRIRLKCVKSITVFLIEGHSNLAVIALVLSCACAHIFNHNLFSWTTSRTREWKCTYLPFTTVRARLIV